MTLAPLVMSVLASDRNVESDPWAFWMMMSDDGTPAASSAFLRSGWSNSTYRVELVVSGRIAATLPLPLCPSGFRPCSPAKSLLDAGTESVGVLPEPPLVLVPLPEPDDPDEPDVAA